MLSRKGKIDGLDRLTFFLARPGKTSFALLAADVRAMILGCLYFGRMQKIETLATPFTATDICNYCSKNLSRGYPCMTLVGEKMCNERMNICDDCLIVIKINSRVLSPSDPNKFFVSRTKCLWCTDPEFILRMKCLLQPEIFSQFCSIPGKPILARVDEFLYSKCKKVDFLKLDLNNAISGTNYTLDLLDTIKMIPLFSTNLFGFFSLFNFSWKIRFLFFSLSMAYFAFNFRKIKAAYYYGFNFPLTRIMAKIAPVAQILYGHRIVVPIILGQAAWNLYRTGTFLASSFFLLGMNFLLYKIGKLKV